MKSKIKQILLKIYLVYHSVMTNISIALYNAEIDILKANPDDLDDSKKVTQKKLHRNKVLNSMDQGIKDEKYVQDYYQILKKADLFMKNATPHKMAVVNDKYSLVFRDENGLEVDKSKEEDELDVKMRHDGFFHKKHKNFGKTLGEVLDLEKNERRVDDDNYEILHIIDNKPSKFGFKDLDLLTVVEGDEVRVLTEREIASKLIFPIDVRRDDDSVVNKIEMLTETLHIKKVAFNVRLFEFLIPNKYKLNELEEDSPIWNELRNIKYIYIKDKYGELTGFTVHEHVKTFQYSEIEYDGVKKHQYSIIKFKGIEMNIDDGSTIGENINNENEKIII